MYIFKEYEPKGIYCNIIGTGTAILGAGLIGAAATAYSANKASEAQTGAANQAGQIAMGMYNTTRGDLAPFRQIGTNAAGELERRLPFLTSPIVMDQAALEQTPGYQFTKTQGLKAVQNSAAARGLGTSGAALKGAANYATGLADTTYQTQFNLENINRTNAYNRLKGLVDTGGWAAGATGTAGQAAAGQAGSAAMAAGNAQAAGINAVGGAVSGLANNLGGYAAYKGIYGANPGGNNAGNWNPSLPAGNSLQGDSI